MDELYLNKGNYIYLSDYNKLINKELRSIFFKNSKNKSIYIEEVKTDENIIRDQVKNLKQASFEITQNCNLRCKYCSYSGKYIYARKHSTKTMNYDKAIRSINFLFDLIKNRGDKEITLGFYGGEPLLCFKDIKMIVSYIKDLFKGWKLEFQITTNGTILNNEILDFLIYNNFFTLISLDGPKENHDSKRIFKNGKGTFNSVLNNLKKIRDSNELYYKKRVNFSAVYSSDLGYKKMVEFFKTNDLVNKNNVRYAAVIPFDTNYYDIFPFNIKKVKKEAVEVLSEISKKIKNKEELSPIEKEIIFIYSSFENDLNAKNFDFLFGACMFNIRLYIDVDGRFHICEKMNDKFSFGDLDSGFAFKKMKWILDEYISINKEKCQFCDIRFLCSRCYIYFAKDREFKIDQKFCKMKKELILNKLNIFIKLKEEGII